MGWWEFGEVVVIEVDALLVNVLWVIGCEVVRLKIDLNPVKQ